MFVCQVLCNKDKGFSKLAFKVKVSARIESEVGRCGLCSGGKGGRGSRSTRGQANKQETTQKAGAEVKVDAAEKKIPPLKLSLKKEAQQSIPGEATDHKSAPQEDPLLDESLSGLEIIPETLEPGQPVQSGLPAVAGQSASTA